MIEKISRPNMIWLQQIILDHVFKKRVHTNYVLQLKMVVTIIFREYFRKHLQQLLEKISSSSVSSKTKI